jgi:hypothetical protein
MDADSFQDAEEDKDPNKMTIPQIKAWLTDHGHEGKVWELSQSRAPKKKYVEYILSLNS